VSLKKPTEFFGKNNNKKEEITTNLPENLGEYKSNLKNIEVLNEFTENFGSFADNITKINTLEEGIQELKEELKNTLTQDDLDNAVMSNLLILEKNIDNIQKSLKGINRENLKNIYEEVENISNQVSLVTEELPRYKNLIKSNEVYLDKKLVQYQESVNENLTDFSNFIDNKFDSIEQSIEDSIEGINENALNKITTNVKNIEKLVNTEIPRHKKQVTEKVIEIDEKFSSYQKNIENYQEQIQLKIQEVQQSFETLFENEVPKYQSLLTNAKIENDKKVESIVNKLTHKIKALAENTLKLNEELEDKSNVLDQAFETKISALESYILNAKKEAEETTQTYRKLYQVIEAKGLSDRSQFDTYEKAISHISSQFSSVYEKIEETKKEIEKKELYQEELNNIQEGFNHKFIQVETLIENKNQKLKEANEVLVDNIVSLKEEVSKISVSELHQNYHQISRKVNHIEEVFSNFNEKTLLNEGLLNEPPEIKTKDPLTPLDQNFVTLDQLQSHYRLFINRIQQQLSTIGGGGETRLEFLDDVDRDSAKVDGYVLAYQASTGKFIGTSVSGGGSASQWVSTTAGIHTLSNVGIGTTNPTEALFVVGNAVFTGNISVAGTVTYDDVTNVDSVGVITARQDVIVQRNLFVSGITTLGASNGIGTVTIGIGNTALLVEGNARVTGILSIGQGTVTIDGNNNTITSGQVTISGSSITLGDNVVINAGASGINSAPNVLYVAKDGNNNNNGTSIDNAKLTIASAVSIAQSGTTIKVLSGSYNENNPIIVPPFVAIVGDSLKTVTVVPNNSTQDIFHLNKGTYLSQMTFTGHTAPSAAVAFPTGIATNVGGGSWESPYVQNCTSNTTTGTGMRIDGALAEELKSMVVDSYTQYNQGGVGIAITNNGYAQLVSVFTICCSEAITVHKGGQCSLTNSNSDFGTFGLVANGVSDLQFVGTAASATAGTDNVTVAITTTTRPYEGQVVYFGELYQSVNTITVTNGGSGYTTAPTVTIAAPAGPSGITATAFASILNGSVTEITLITSGSQYTEAPSITISAPGSGTTATATATTSPIYYTINSSTPIVSGTTTLTLEENLNNTVSTGSTVYFFQVSKITASSHTFEYVGSGNTIATATPSRGGVPIPENEIIETAGGRVVFTSTDQSGNFKIGNDITINQNNGTITGRAFTRSLFNQMTPFILALS
jgi:hypothetical protein